MPGGSALLELDAAQTMKNALQSQSRAPRHSPCIGAPISIPHVACIPRVPSAYSTKARPESECWWARTLLPCLGSARELLKVPLHPGRATHSCWRPDRAPGANLEDGRFATDIPRARHSNAVCRKTEECHRPHSGPRSSGNGVGIALVRPVTDARHNGNTMPLCVPPC